MDMELDDQRQNRGFDKRILLESILLQILSRLPVKSLLKFMCVCKRWRTLISSRTFRKLHQERHSSPLPMILALHSSEEMTCEEDLEDGMLPDFYLTTFDLYGNVLQCRTLPISAKYLGMMPIPPQAKLLCFIDYKENTNFFYNPSTRQIFPLPNPPSFSLPKDTSNPWVRLYGYIPSKDEYIMTVMCESKYSHKSWVCEILAVSTSDDSFQLHYGQWRSIEVTPKLKRMDAGVFVSGAFYWKVQLEAGDEEEYGILSFDVETNVFATFGLPQGVGKCCAPFELRDELYLTNLTGRYKYLDYTTLEVWKFGIYDNKKLWTPYWKIDFRDIGYIALPKPNEFERDVLIWRLEYLNLYSSKVSKEMGKLVFLREHLELEEDEEGKLKPLGEDIIRPLVEEDYGSVSEYFMEYEATEIHSNLFTL